MSYTTVSRVALLGIPIDAVTADQAVAALFSFLEQQDCVQVMTPNSEMLVEAIHNKQFRAVLQSAALNIPDSAGLLYASRWTHQRLPARVTGVDTVTSFCKKLTNEHSVFLLGSAPGIAARAAHELQKENISLRIVGTYAGSTSSDDAGDIIKKINDSGAHVLLVAYGAPKQDLWIHEHLHEFTTVRLAIGVGGTFDFLSGKVKRAPKLLRSIGLEWTWRLLLQPSRIKRIFNAVVVFPLLILRYGKRYPS